LLAAQNVPAHERCSHRFGQAVTKSRRNRPQSREDLNGQRTPRLRILPSVIGAIGSPKRFRRGFRPV
jgi:hypothetical protein